MKEQKEKLIEYRTLKCKERNCGPNRVFTERDIDAIIAAQPRSLADLAKVPGFPADGRRMEQYGADIIKIMNSAVTHDSSLRSCNCFGL